MLEAKIIEVALSDQFQSGINWAVFNRSGGFGQITRPSSPSSQQAGSVTTQQLRDAATAQLLNGPAGAGPRRAVARSHCPAPLTFLQTPGHVPVASSPPFAPLTNT